MNITDLIPQELYMLIIALWVIGFMIKSLKTVKDAYIPFILTVISVAIVFCMKGVSSVTFLQAIICAAIAVYGKNLLVQAKEMFSPDLEAEILSKPLMDLDKDPFLSIQKENKKKEEPFKSEKKE